MLELLKDFNNWWQLGIKLGLRYQTLENIDTQRRGNVGNCTMDMLASWLKQQDNVSSKNGPTYQQLIESLSKLGEDTSSLDFCEIERNFKKRKADQSNSLSSSKRAKFSDDKESSHGNQRKRTREEEDVTPSRKRSLPVTGRGKGPSGKNTYRKKGT